GGFYAANRWSPQGAGDVLSMAGRQGSSRGRLFWKRPILDYGRRATMRVASIIAAGASLLSAAVGAAEIHVISTQATQEAYLELVAQFEKASGHKVKTVFNGTLNVQKRLADGEPCDLIIMASPAIDEQIKLGRALAGSRVDLAKSGTGVAV